MTARRAATVALVLSTSTVLAAEPQLGTRAAAASAAGASQSPVAAAPSSAARVAVLVFANISGAPADEWIGAGIAETLTADLARAGGLIVIGRDSVSAARESPSGGERADGDERATIDAARRLGARWLVGGGYQRVGDRLRITARVVDVETTGTVHRARVDGLLSELFSLQDRLVAELRGSLPAGGDRPRTATAARPPARVTPVDDDAGSATRAPVTTPSGRLPAGSPSRQA